MLGKKWKVVLAAAAIGCLAAIPATAMGALGGISLPAGTSGSSMEVKVATSGATSGTQLVALSIDANGNAVKTGSEKVSATSTHGSYVAPSGLVYVNKFAGGGIEVYKKEGNSWQPYNKDKWLTATTATMNCSLDLAKGTEDPDTGQLQLGDIASGFSYLINMNNGAPAWANSRPAPVGGEAGILGGSGTTCDLVWTENPVTNTAVSSGHTNNVYVWDTSLGQTLPTGDTVYGLRTIFPAENKLGHQDRTITAPNGKEYVFVADGSAGQILVLDSAMLSDPANAQNARVGRITVGGEMHSTGFIVDGVKSNKAISNYGVIADFSVGSLKVVQLFKADGTPNVDGAGQQKPVVTSTIPAIGGAGDICGVDIVDVNGVWQRN